MRKFGKVRQVCKLMGVNSREISDFRKIKCGEKLWRWFTSVFFPNLFVSKYHKTTGNDLWVICEDFYKDNYLLYLPEKQKLPLPKSLEILWTKFVYKLCSNGTGTVQQPLCKCKLNCNNFNYGKYRTCQNF